MGIEVKVNQLSVNAPEYKDRWYHKKQAGPEILKRVDLEISSDTHSFTALRGPSGSGKSTLLLAMLGGLPGGAKRPAEGTVEWDGQNVFDRRIKEQVLGRVGFVPQTVLPIGGLTVGEQVSLPSSSNNSGPRVPQKKLNARIAGTLEQVGLEKKPSDTNEGMSAGELRKLAIASALFGRHVELLLLDEPTAGLDEASKGEINQLLASIHDEGTPIFLVTHEETSATQTLWLHHNQIQEHSPAGDIEDSTFTLRPDYMQTHGDIRNA